MLPQTFCHLPGIGATKEARLWAAGCNSWEQADSSLVKFPPQRLISFQQAVEQSQHELAQGNAEYFGNCLPSCEQWRLYREFRDHAAYVDIETTGVNSPGNYITTIALYDGRQVRHYVHGDNLHQFKRDKRSLRLLGRAEKAAGISRWFQSF